MKDSKAKDILLQMVLTSGRSTKEILEALKWVESHTRTDFTISKEMLENEYSLGWQAGMLHHMKMMDQLAGNNAN